ncbi:Respiratory-chain NADH dehydrogenase, subunit [Paucidesulfovibrio gracilis DSM 16080]|uniref:Respiratory-chain NADH dehydrogenase, subunit n=1 Tax=Paucidesulfovibrio gracilis DSM 16080 TaxID=1121449 RepID=A0A1T4WC27_9BACT|nr:NADH-quinone oxidoreductase subunit C [Paucidesulfovibrio gracilis]SKA74261.1 Respiratory-chain NADH dehydrogenase, subunit [Paucidesulfovibrio gracilis DSM 16080]
MKGNEISVTRDNLVSEVMNMKNEGCRFVTISTALTAEDAVDVLYHFEKDFEVTHLRLSDHPLAEAMPSISGVYFGALLAENELQDLFGMKFSGLVLDFNRTLYLEEEVTVVPLVNNCKVAGTN